MKWLLGLALWVAGCGPAVRAPAVPEWRTETEALRGAHFLDGRLDAAGQARLAFLLDFEAGDPAQADLIAPRTPAQHRAAAFRAIERRAPGWAALAEAAIAAEPSAPESAALAAAARHAGAQRAEPALQPVAVARPAQLRAAWWSAWRRGAWTAGPLAARWATAWPRHAPAWFAVGVTTADPGAAVAALSRAAEAGHVDAGLALVERLRAAGRLAQAEAWAARLARTAPGAITQPTPSPKARPVAQAQPASSWSIRGEVGPERFRVRVTGPAEVLRAGLSGSAGEIAARLAQTLPGAWPSAVRCSAAGRFECVISGRIDAGPGRWLRRPLSVALGANPTAAFFADWTLRPPSSWRWRRAWASFERAGHWGRFDQRVESAPYGTRVQRSWAPTARSLEPAERAAAARVLHAGSRDVIAEGAVREGT